MGHEGNDSFPKGDLLHENPNQVPIAGLWGTFKVGRLYTSKGATVKCDESYNLFLPNFYTSFYQSEYERARKRFPTVDSVVRIATTKTELVHAYRELGGENNPNLDSLDDNESIIITLPLAHEYKDDHGAHLIIVKAPTTDGSPFDYIRNPKTGERIFTFPEDHDHGTYEIKDTDIVVGKSLSLGFLPNEGSSGAREITLGGKVLSVLTQGFGDAIDLSRKHPELIDTSFFEIFGFPVPLSLQARIKGEAEIRYPGKPIPPLDPVSFNEPTTRYEWAGNTVEGKIYNLGERFIKLISSIRGVEFGGEYGNKLKARRPSSDFRDNLEAPSMKEYFNHIYHEWYDRLIQSELVSGFNERSYALARGHVKEYPVWDTNLRRQIQCGESIIAAMMNMTEFYLQHKSLPIPEKVRIVDEGAGKIKIGSDEAIIVGPMKTREHYAKHRLTVRSKDNKHAGKSALVLSTPLSSSYSNVAIENVGTCIIGEGISIDRGNVSADRFVAEGTTVYGEIHINQTKITAENVLFSQKVYCSSVELCGDGTGQLILKENESSGMLVNNFGECVFQEGSFGKLGETSTMKVLKIVPPERESNHDESKYRNRIMGTVSCDTVIITPGVELPKIDANGQIICKELQFADQQPTEETREQIIRDMHIILLGTGDPDSDSLSPL